MDLHKLIESWFEKWENGDFLNLPVSDDFRHTSPFGTITGKDNYIKLVQSNRDKFLGYRFIIHDKLFDDNKACVRYTAIQGEFKLDVSEWYVAKEGLISEIIAYYHIGEIKDDRKLNE